MKKTLGIIGAEQQEIDLLLEHLSLEKTVKKAGLSFFCGTIHEYPVVIVKAGIGKVNAAACTQMLIDLFSTALLNGDSSDVEVSFKLLTDVLKKNKDFAKAVEYYDKYIQYRFSKRI